MASQDGPDEVWKLSCGCCRVGRLMARQGASPRELVLEACRRNNVDLLQDVINNLSKKSASTSLKAADRVAEVINNAVDGIGNHCLHLAATSGSCESHLVSATVLASLGSPLQADARKNVLGVDEVMDLILDQEGVEVDPLDRFEKDTPLHKAVRFVNGLPKSQWPNGQLLVDLLVDAGADPRSDTRAVHRDVPTGETRSSGYLRNTKD